MWIVPVNSDDCATDWNYNFHGADWVCRCNEGQEQSPIDLDHFGNLEKITTNAEFEFQYRQKDELQVIFKNNMLRIRVKKNEDDV
jgi:carbonic anhydrase